jgi:hypothetical protein
MTHTIRLIMLLLLLGSNVSLAAQKQPTVSQAVHKVLIEAQTFSQKRQYIKALAKLNSLNDSALSGFEQSQLWNFKGFTYYEQEQYKKAIDALSNSLQYRQLPEPIRLNTLQTIAQTHFSIEQYQQAINLAEQYITINSQNSPQIFLLKGQAQYQLKQYQAAINSIKQAISIKQTLGKKVDEQDLLILSACQQELEQYPQQIQTLKQLISLYPQKRYFLALAGAFYETGDTKRQLSLYETLYEKQSLSEPQQLKNLAQLYLLNDAPYKAAKVIEQAIAEQHIERNVNNLNLLARAWYAARSPEKAIPPLIEAASKTKNGRQYMKLGYLFSQMERWDDAIDAFSQAKKKGGLAKKNNMELLTGIACFHAGHMQKAKKAFKQAISQQHYASSAKTWLNVLNQQQMTVIN